MKLAEPCTLWSGAIEETGYGRRKVAGKMWMAHRYAYYVAHGDIPDGMVVDHLCFNRACVEVTHLRLLTREANAVRHHPECRCPKHDPESRVLKVCAQGRDVSLPENRRRPSGRDRLGRCAECDRRKAREYGRRKRAASAALAFGL